MLKQPVLRHAAERAEAEIGPIREKGSSVGRRPAGVRR